LLNQLISRKPSTNGTNFCYKYVIKAKAMNYSIVAIIGAVAVVLILFLIWRNRKDEKDFKKSFTQSELKPDEEEKLPPPVE